MDGERVGDGAELHQPDSRNSRMRRYGSGREEISEAWERANEFLANERRRQPSTVGPLSSGATKAEED